MTTEQNKALVRRITDNLSRQNLDAVFAEFSPDFQDHDDPPPGIPPGIEGTKLFLTMLFNAFPDLQITTEDLIAQDDRVVERLTIGGTHKGVFLGTPPTGKRVTWGLINIYRIADGKIVDLWSEHDRLGLMQQLGVIPMPEHGTP